MTSLVIENVRKSFGHTEVLKGVSLTINSGDFFFILGASGCGKSTLLRIIAGLDHQDSGRITVDGADLTQIPAHRRGIGMVFQQYALWPHMTVSQNVSFGLEVQGVEKEERRRRVDEALASVRMGGLGSRYPHEISGGQQQRVALARALAVRPRMILLDEPLSNLDARLRHEIRSELQELHASLKLTMIYVTHDQEDALTLATQIALLNAGRVEQVGTPHQMYTTPQSRYAAEFLGSANILPCEVSPAARPGFLMAHISGPTTSQIEARASASIQAGTGLLCVRPESLDIRQRSDGEAGAVLEAIVHHITYRGAYLDVECKLERGERVLSRIVSAHAPAGLSVGAPVSLSWRPEAAVIVPKP